VEAAQADQESAQASLNDVRVSLVAEVAKDYVEVRSFQIRLDIARTNLAPQSETSELTLLRAKAGTRCTCCREKARRGNGPRRGGRSRAVPVLQAFPARRAAGLNPIDALRYE
jgi:hypothetical protein